jgi:hypothetical protein
VFAPNEALRTPAFGLCFDVQRCAPTLHIYCPPAAPFHALPVAPRVDAWLHCSSYRIGELTPEVIPYFVATQHSSGTRCKIRSQFLNALFNNSDL